MTKIILDVKLNGKAGVSFIEGISIANFPLDFQIKVLEIIRDKNEYARKVSEVRR